jgi:signal transduction histidine kinase
VATSDEARRRIERDLHDGAQQRLVSAVVVMRMALAELGDDDSPVAKLLEEALGHAQRGLSDVREIARGVHPRILSSGGLGPALEGLARRSTVPVSVDVTSDLQLEENVAVTAYYVASEALTNAAKYAHASKIRLTVDVHDGWLVLTIRDDGVGGADPSRGTGLIGLRDRVVALGGTLALHSEAGAGTVLTAQIPVAVPAAAPAEA